MTAEKTWRRHRRFASGRCSSSYADTGANAPRRSPLPRASAGACPATSSVYTNPRAGATIRASA